MSQNIKYVCRESYGPYKKGVEYTDVPDHHKDTPIFVKVAVEPEAPVEKDPE